MTTTNRDSVVAHETVVHGPGSGVGGAVEGVDGRFPERGRQLGEGRVQSVDATRRRRRRRARRRRRSERRTGRRIGYKPAVLLHEDAHMLLEGHLEFLEQQTNGEAHLRSKFQQNILPEPRGGRHGKRRVTNT